MSHHFSDNPLGMAPLKDEPLLDHIYRVAAIPDDFGRCPMYLAAGDGQPCAAKLTPVENENLPTPLSGLAVWKCENNHLLMEGPPSEEALNFVASLHDLI